MKNKNIYVKTIIKSVITFIFLLYIINKDQDVISIIIMIPFLLCSFFSMGKEICLIIGKKKFAILFTQLFVISFLIFWFGLLLFGTLSLIKGNDYFSVVFTVPFWIAGIYMIRHFLFNIH